DDYQDGTGAAGPYVHTYKDATGNTLGTFSLEITPPPSGSTVVTIKSTGQITNRPTSSRTVTVQQGIPSFTKWAVVANADIRFGVGTEVFGPIHSNGGIRFDGLAHNLVSSYRYSYDDPDHTGSNELGVHTHVTPLDAIPPVTPPATIASRPDVFAVGRQVQANFVDFNSISVDMQAMKTKASANGIYVLPSGGQGYHITFRQDGKVDMRIVNTQLRCQYRSGAQWRDYGYCSNNYNLTCTQNSNCTSGATCIQSSHSIGTRAADQAAFTYQSASSLGVPIPANGLIFIEDDAWVDGVVPNGTRLTLVAAKEPLASGLANIYLDKDLTYGRYCNNATQNACSLDSECTGGATCVDVSNGTSAVGLITQQNILVGYFSENNLRLDAALIAQNGRVGRPNFGASGSSYQLYPTGSPLPNGGGGENSCDDFRSRSLITTFGALATNQRYGFAWTGGSFCNSSSSGYCTRTLNFDANLTYAPPPDFPTTGQYEALSWEEQ
ncbi:MAG: dickkopf-related protein, partial [Patescibacteria group bacterium]